MCPRYVKISQKYPQDILKICPKYAQYMPKICQRYVRDLPKIKFLFLGWLTGSPLPTATTTSFSFSDQSMWLGLLIDATIMKQE